MTEYVKKLLIFGPPGAGKGTQASRVTQDLGIPHIDTGSMIRENIARKTPLGLEAQSYVEKGELSPSEMVIRMISDRLKWDDAVNGWLLDGFPRSIEQAEALSVMGPDGGEVVERVLFIEVPEELLVQRLTSRRICGSCGAVYNLITLKPSKEGICDKCDGELIQRADDNEESVRNRFRVYRESTAPIADYYEGRGLIVSVDGQGGVEEVNERILAACIKA